MRGLEELLALFLAAVALASAARRFGAPYPVFLALGGALLAFVPGAPSFTVPPELALALFVAPVLLDAAFDASLRDLRDNWAPVTGLVVCAVALTTAAVAVVVRTLLPEVPWAPAIVLGAVVAPPDAAAATAVLRQLRPPHRILTILEGESLLNDASALLIYRLAVGAAAAHSFSLGAVAPTFLLAVAGSVVVGPVLGWLVFSILARVEHVPSAIILQFVSTFGVWIAAEHLGLSGVLTMVCYAVTVARWSPERTPARTRVPTYAVWETVVFALNVLAFIFIGLQVRPILDSLGDAERGRYLVAAARGAHHRHRRSPRVAHDLQRGSPMATPPVWLQSAATDAAADGRQRPGDLVGGDARHRLARRGDGAAAGVPVPRPDRAHRIPGGARHAHHPGTHVEALVAIVEPARWRSRRPGIQRARGRILEAALSVLEGDASSAAESVRRELGARLAPDVRWSGGRYRRGRCARAAAASRPRSVSPGRPGDACCWGHRRRRVPSHRGRTRLAGDGGTHARLTVRPG